MTTLPARHAALPRLARRPRTAAVAGRLTAITVADQAVISLSNVAMLLIAAASLPLTAFGTFAVAAMVVQLGQTAAGAALGDRLLQAAHAVRGARYIAGQRLLIAASVACAAAVAAAVLAEAVTGTRAPVWLLVLALIPALAITDQWRVHAIALRRPGAALRVDATLALVQVAAIAGWWWSGRPLGVVGALTAWWLAAFATTAWVRWPGWNHRHPELRPTVRPAAVRDAVSVRYGVETVAVSGAGQIAQLVVTAQLGLAFAGTLRAVQIPFGLVVVVILAARPLMITRLASLDVGRARRATAAAAIAMVALAAIAALATIVAARESALRFLVGGLSPSAPYVLAVAAGYAAFGAATMYIYGARAAGRDQEVTVGRLVAIAGMAIGTATTLVTDSVWTFLLTIAVAWTAGLIAMAFVRHRHRQHHGTIGAPGTYSDVGVPQPPKVRRRRPHRLLTLVAFLLPPGRVKNWILRRLGHHVDRTARIGPVLVVDVSTFVVGSGATIGPFNVFRSLREVRMDVGAYIGQFNWFSAAPEFRDATASASRLLLDEHAAVVSRHYLDCSGGIALGRFAIMGGLRSTILTHHVSYRTGRLECDAVRIGEYALVNAANNLVAGAVVPDRSITGIGSVVLPGLTEPDSLYAGSPARRIKSVAGGALFSRTDRVATA